MPGLHSSLWTFQRVGIPDIEVVIVYGLPKTTTEPYNIQCTTMFDIARIYFFVWLCSCLAVLVVMAVFPEATCSIPIEEWRKGVWMIPLCHSLLWVLRIEMWGYYDLPTRKSLFSRAGLATFCLYPCWHLWLSVQWCGESKTLGQSSLYGCIPAIVEVFDLNIQPLLMHNEHK